MRSSDGKRRSRPSPSPGTPGEGRVRILFVANAKKTLTLTLPEYRERGPYVLVTDNFTGPRQRSPERKKP
jgi:hypothetical protein